MSQHAASGLFWSKLSRAWISITGNSCVNWTFHDTLHLPFKMKAHLNLPLTNLTASLLAGRFFLSANQRASSKPIQENQGDARRESSSRAPDPAVRRWDKTPVCTVGDRGTRGALGRRAPAPLLSLWIRRQWGFAKVTAVNIYMPRLAPLSRRESAVKQAGCSSVTSQALQAGLDVGLLSFLVSLITSLLGSCCSCLHLPCSMLVSVQHRKPSE